jgi:hypothetical protein
MSLCASCSEQADRQAEQMKPRLVTEGRVLVTKKDGLTAVFGNEQPDIRMGDIVFVKLIAGAAEDMGWCSDESCDAYRH